ncbi:MAG: heavy metal translocating P-type ATPase [Deltaproteobacteria bacterium]|nr:heavy metal translocating P-type ATPase [Deltaproteobacteria bacterium]
MTRGPREERLRVVHRTPTRVRLHGGMLMDPALDVDYVCAYLENMPGVHSARMNVRAGSVAIRHDGVTNTDSALVLALSILPKEAFRSDPGQTHPPDLIGVAAQAGVAAATPFLPRPVQAALSWFLAAPTLAKGAETILTRGLKIEVLDASVKLLSLLRGDYFTTNVVGALLALSEYVEHSAERRSNDLLKNLMRPQVETVKVDRGGIESTLPFDEVRLGDVVICGTGDLVPVDGVVLSGKATLNTSSITGESAPVACEEGAGVVSGSIVEEGKLYIEATQVGSETSMARISSMLEKSLRSKSPSQKRSEELADRLVPLTFGAGAGLYALTGDMRRAASVLTVDYSCAVKLSYPVAVRSAMYSAAKEGVLIKGAQSLDALSRVDTFVFDKTGTLTRGSLRVTDLVALPGYVETDLLSWAAGAEQHYGHPVARAVTAKAREVGLKLPDMSNVDFIVAHGVSAYVDGIRVLVGSRHFIHDDEGIDCRPADNLSSELLDQGKSLLFVARGSELVGLIGMRDDLRPEAGESLRLLRQFGVSRLVVLSGDHVRTAQAVCAHIPELDEVHAELKPEDKAAVVERLKSEGRRIAFVGDGVNDAPAMLAADVGVCMPKGADLARESAQVVLMGEDIRALPLALSIAKRTDTTLRRCVLSAIGINSGIMALAAAGYIPAVLSAAAHNSTTVGILAYSGLRGVNGPSLQTLQSRSLSC